MTLRNAMSPSIKVVVDCGGLDASLTKQSQADECDINKLMAKYHATGELTHVRDAIPQFGDFTSEDDYHSALIKIRGAENAFSELPSATRAFFDNEPGKMSAWVNDQSNYKQALEMGLISTEAAEAMAAAFEANSVPTPPVTPGENTPDPGAGETD